MADIKILIQNNHRNSIPLNGIEDTLTQVGHSYAIDWLSNEKGKRISFEDEQVESVYNLMEDAILANEADAFILPAQDLPYPLNTKLEVCAVLKEQVERVDGPHPLNGLVVIVGRKEDCKLKQYFAAADESANWGSVALAGFGPGDGGLITKKAEYHLHRCEVIFYDDLVNEEYLRRFCAKKIYVGKRKGNHKYDQEKINELMYQEALKGKWVVRIKGGDPLIFGRGAEEYHYLQSRLIQAEIIPGISSAFAAAAHAIIPFTERSLASSVVLLSGHDLHKLKIPIADTLVFYMGASNQKALAKKVVEEGWSESTPVGVVHNVSNPNQQIYRGTLEDMMNNGSGLPSPSIIIVGKTAGEYSGQNKKWLYTGASLDEVKSHANLVHTPLISIEKKPTDSEINFVMKNISSYKRLVFTNRYAVYHFFDKLFEAGKDVRDLFGVQIDSIGKTTSKALKEKGLLIKPLSEVESVEGMLQVYGKERIVAEDILIPCSNLSTGTLQRGLRRLGNRVKSLEVYETVKNKAIIKQDLSRFEGVIFSSPSTVKAFFEVYGSLPFNLEVKCKGSLTESVLEDLINGKVIKEQVAV